MRRTGLNAFAGFMAAASALAATLAHAALVISKASSSNVTCIRGTCTATAADAVLNVKDLHKLLNTSDVTLVSGSAAMDIAFLANVFWTKPNRMTVDSWRAITVGKAVVSQGGGGITLTTNDGGTGGDYSFTGGGRIAFWDLASSLIINGNAYTLVGDLETLSTDVANAPAGFYALGRAIKETGDKSPNVKTPLQGTFEGLGRSISGIRLQGRQTYVGLFAETGSTAIIRDVDITDAEASYGRKTHYLGILVGRNGGTILNCTAEGGIDYNDKPIGRVLGGLVGWNDGTILRSSAAVGIAPGATVVGGLAGINNGTIDQSHAAGGVSSSFPYSASFSAAGGLVGQSNGLITRSFATGGVGAQGGYEFNYVAYAGGLAGRASNVDQSFATGQVHTGYFSYAGGLVGEMQSNSGQGYITNSYSTGSVDGEFNGDGGFGGFAGESAGVVSTSYSTGALTNGDSDCCGGFFGRDYSNGLASATYWDLDTSGISDPSKGASNIANDPGITGLTDAQLKAGLPAGFDPNIWGQNAAINNGYPYLLANPPPQ